MKFLEGSRLSIEMKRLASSTGRKKIAIAYWGSNALKLLAIDPRRPEVQIVCCLKGGKSAPEVISQFGKRALQNDLLHAKIIWSEGAAIVGSANASSNGLPDEENLAGGLIEAGVLVTDAVTLTDIEAWFDRVAKKARSISRDDLEAAKLDRAKYRYRRNQELIEISPALLTESKLGVFVWAGRISDSEDRSIRKLPTARQLGLKRLRWYLDSAKNARNYPYEHRVLTYEVSLDRKLIIGKPELQYFLTRDDHHRVDGATVIYALQEPMSAPGLPPFKFGRKSDRAIRASLLRRGFKLEQQLNSGTSGFVAWEPLAALLDVEHSRPNT